MITAGLITEAGLVVTGTGCVIAGAGCAIGGSISYTGNVIGDYLAKDIEVDGVLNNSVTPEESKQILTDNLSIFTNVWIKNPITGFLADKVVRKAVKGIDKWLERTK